MSIETQLRGLAAAAVAEQRPVTADEALARATDRYVFDDRPDRHSWTLAAATIAIVVGGLVALLAWNRAPDHDPPHVVSIPETVAPDTTIPTTTAPTPTSVPSTTGSAPDEVLVNEPTLDYRDGVEWWTPTQLPGGWHYGYAADDGEVQTIRLFADDGSTIDIEFGAGASSIDVLAGDATVEDLGDESWQVFEEGLARQIDGRLLVVLGPVEPARTVAAGLALASESDLVRPPFRADAEPGPVVLTLPADEVDGEEPFELHAHTDGLFTSVGGDIKRVSADDPVGFGDYVYDLSGDAESYRVVLTGVALAGLEQIQFGLLDGDAVEVTPTPSTRFAEDFYAVVIDVPAAALEQYELGALERLTRWTLTHVDGEQRVYDEPGAANCVNCEDFPGSGEPGPVPPVRVGAPLEFEPTNVYGDELWWIPAEVPDGYEFEYAMQWWGFEGDHTVAYRSTDPQGTPLTVGQSSAAEPTGIPPTAEEQIGAVTWSWTGTGDTHGELSRIVDGRRVTVNGDRQAALAAAATLELVPESRLERPPFRYGDDLSTSVVVASAPGDDGVELRVSTDGVAVSIDGSQPEPITAGRPLTVRGGGGGCGDDGCLTRVFGITAPDVATVDIEQLDGAVITVVPDDLSDHFGGLGFFIVELELPAFAADFPMVLQSVIARDADGEIVAAMSEPL